MAKNTSSWFVLIIMVMIIFLGVLGAGVAIDYFGKKVTEKQIEIDNDLTGDSPEMLSYVADDWSIEYPSNWEYKEYSDGRVVGFDYAPYEQIAGEYNGLVVIENEENLGLEELKKMTYNLLENQSEEGVYVNGVYGTTIEGVVNTSAMGEGKLGAKNIVTFFELDNGNIFIIELKNADRQEDVMVYQQMLHSLQLGETTQTDQNLIASSSPEGNVIVYSPTSGETIKSPFTATGKARVFENVVNYELKDSKGNVLADGFVTAHAADIGQFGEFEIDLSFVTSDESGTLEVYTTSAKDGSKEDVVGINVKFEK